ARHVADDEVTRHGLTALRVAHHEAILALDANALRTAYAIDEPLENAGFGRLGLVRVGVEVPERERDVDVALPDGGQQVRRVGEAQRLRRGEHLVVVRPREPAPLDLAVEHVLPELLGRRLRFALENLSNLVARAAGADVREPIARRPSSVRRDDLD